MITGAAIGIIVGGLLGCALGWHQARQRRRLRAMLTQINLYPMLRARR